MLGQDVGNHFAQRFSSSARRMVSVPSVAGAGLSVGDQRGNPQAFTHLALISSAFNLDRALDQHRPGRRL